MELKLTFENKTNLITPTNYLPNTVPSMVKPQINYLNDRTIIPNPRLVPNMYITPKIQSIPVVPISNPGQPIKKCCGNTNVY